MATLALFLAPFAVGLYIGFDFMRARMYRRATSGEQPEPIAVRDDFGRKVNVYPVIDYEYALLQRLADRATRQERT